ncbi:phospholipid-translocating P-type ATPase [Dacryopinax primogenitus]|uniref:Phospholipid-transporting ATPase n=1 Tax=Dacryopinax primogenitus (strain DJM 731) TaxID=1858805 RepID=M5GA32_DACPD|nr:phospholipid-translocating P-type ATPase [Dacryopinax primogenitus]EJU00708.1 phospholipid-translocating P-type ATPase [Dacryopinax primogenitus]
MAYTKSSKRPPKHNKANQKPSFWSRLSSISAEHLIERLFEAKPRPSGPRTVYLNENLPQECYDSKHKGRVRHDCIYNTNQVVTSKYTVITFVPRNLLEQFRRVANLFFLGIDVLQFFPKFATISPGLVILPLIVVLAITGAKAGYEDLKRHQSDRKGNQSPTHVLTGGGYVNPNQMGRKARTYSIPLPWKKKKVIDEEKIAEDEKELRRVMSERSEHPEREIEMRERDVKVGVVRTSSSAAGGSRPHADSTGSTTLRASGDEFQPMDVDQDALSTASRNTPHFGRTVWEDIAVGSFIKIYNNESVPADIVICATSEPENVAFVETKNLDGETNLKSRRSVEGLTHLRTAHECALAQFRIEAEAPHVDMYKLNAAVVMYGEDGSMKHPVDAQMCLLRGTVLRNTEWVIGVVLYTGFDTKIMLNSGGTPSKRSKVERQMNPQVIVNLALLAIISVVCAIADSAIEKQKQPMGAYWLYDDNRSGDNPSINGLITFFQALITFQNVIPISLYLSIEFVWTCQAAFIYFDKEIWYDKTDTATLARSWNLSDDLGQIQYVMSDKTGTLTQNKMVFRQCSIGGKMYKGEPDETDEDRRAKAKATSLETSSQSSSDQSATKLLPEPAHRFVDPELETDLRHSGQNAHVQNLVGFFDVLGLCHTVLAGEDEHGKLQYKAQSPDEAALVQAAADVGFVFRGRDKEILRLQTPFSHELEQYELLNVLEFTSARKRMSVVIRRVDGEDHRLLLLSKGADNVIFERLAPGQTDIRSKTDEHLQFFAGLGLRTLCLAYRVLDENEYDAWSREYHEAETALEDRDDKLEEACSKLEQKMRLLGATAIEDKLQDGVPEAIADLKRAGIKVWVATGDKLETAISIGYSTNLLAKDANLVIVRGTGGDSDRTPVYDQLRGAAATFFSEERIEEKHPEVLSPDDYEVQMHGRPTFLRRLSSHHTEPRSPVARGSFDGTRLRRFNTGVSSLVGPDNGHKPGGYSLVIDGAGLAEALAENWSKALLMQVSTRCEAVVCCRVSPKQKAQIVHLVKDGLGAMCLAIGDGANDVSMIQAADVGVGISGEEGLQAVNSSDYAIAQFRFLTRLLFVHGHWSYIRNSNMILNFFYKNIVAIGVLFWFQIYCAWSTTYVFEYTYLLFWNVFWSLCPVIAIGIFDRNIDGDILVALPELYRYGREGRWFGTWRFTIYMLEAGYQSVVIFFFILYAYATTSARSDGWDVDMYEFSTTMVISCVMAVNLYNGINTYAWSGWVWFAVIIGPILCWLYTIVYNAIPPSSFFTFVYGNNYFLFPSAYYWFGLFQTLFLALLPRYVWKTINESYLPDDIDVLRQIRAFYPNIDVKSDPGLGGRFKAETLPEKEELEPHPEPENIYAEPEHATDLLRRSIDSSAAPETPRHNYPPTSDSIYRQRQATGSRTEMSTGRRGTGPGGGFDFSQEEGGFAIQRMQSHLSEMSERRRRERGSLASRLLHSTTPRRDRSGSGGSVGLFPSLRRSTRRRREIPSQQEPPVPSPPEPAHRPT